MTRRPGEVHQARGGTGEVEAIRPGSGTCQSAGRHAVDPQVRRVHADDRFTEENFHLGELPHHATGWRRQGRNRRRHRLGRDGQRDGDGVRIAQRVADETTEQRAVIIQADGVDDQVGKNLADHVLSVTLPAEVQRLRPRGNQAKLRAHSLGHGQVLRLLDDFRRVHRDEKRRESIAGDRPFKRAAGNLPGDGHMVTATPFLLQRLNVILAPGFKVNRGGDVFSVGSPLGSKPVPGAVPLWFGGDQLLRGRILIRAQEKLPLIIAGQIENIIAGDRWVNIPTDP